MQRIELDGEAGQVSAELIRRGVRARARVRVLVGMAADDDLPMAALVEAGGGLGFLDDEPDLYSDADAVERYR